MENHLLRVGVNLVPLQRGRSGGIRQHLVGLLSDLLDFDNGIELICYVSRGSLLQKEFRHPRARFVELLPASKEIEAQAKAGTFDVVFGAAMDNGLVDPVCPSVTLLVDMQHEDLRQNFPSGAIENRRRRWHWSVLASQKICVSTEFVKHRLIHHLGVNPERIVLTPPPLTKVFRSPVPKETEDRFEKQIQPALPDRYLFFPGNTWKHKNHSTLLEALATFKGDDVPHLVLTGWPIGTKKGIQSQISKLGLKDRVHWSGYVEDEMMPLFYRGAEALVYPSLYEGYGIPLVEAMYSDCPILCSNTTSCPEVVGDAALYFDPTNREEIATAIDSLRRDPALASDLAEKGRIQRSKLDQTAAARNLAKALYDAKNLYQDPLRWNWQNESVLYRSSSGDTEAPLVSIIVPSYQHAHFIRDTIESILDQDYPNIECIVVDGGSSDGTVEILQSYGDRIRWISEPDKGQADAINKGFRMAHGKVFAWLNSDDTYLEGAVSKAVAALQKESGSLLVYGEAYYTDHDGNRIGRYMTGTFSPENLRQYCNICQPTVFFWRLLLNQAGYLDQRFHMALDYELWLRYSRITKFLYIPEFLATSRMYAENKTSKYHFRSIHESMKACRRHYKRSSPEWCRQLSLELVSHIPVLRRYKLGRFVGLTVLYPLILVRDIAPFAFWNLARFVYHGFGDYFGR